MRGYIFAGLTMAALAPHVALAQDMTPSLRGFRIEGNVGGDRFQAEGDHKTKFGYGGSAGFDGLIGDRIVIGVEGSYWRPNGDSAACTAAGSGSLCQQSYRELGAAIRAGYLITPKILIFGKGGYVSNLQKNSFGSSTGFYYVNGNIVGPGYAVSRRYSTDGYQAGGGVEYSLTNMVYISGQYVYSRYDHHTSRQRAMFGAGIRFK
jgi:outer membrane immunogenic protein